MKILVIADIHSNWAALQAVDESFDACLVLGDIVDYGTDPVPCIDWVSAHATACVRGNHDHAVAQRVAPQPGQGFRRLAAATRPRHWDVLSDMHLKFLARLPVTNRCTLGGIRFFLVHGTPRDPLDEYLGPDAAGWRQRLHDVDADFVCCGHTHVPFELQLDGVTVLNPGSVGQPRDGDPRCAYAVIEDGRVEFRRVAYDIDAAVAQMATAGLDPDMLRLSEAVLREGGFPDSLD